MIVDGHARIFPPFDSPAGFDSVEDKMRFIQRQFGGHHLPVWRVRDRKPADRSTLLDPDTYELNDVEWTSARGRLSCIYRGLEIPLARRAHSVVANSEAGRQFMIQKGVTPSRAEVVLNGISLTRVADWGFAAMPLLADGRGNAGRLPVSSDQQRRARARRSRRGQNQHRRRPGHPAATLRRTAGVRLAGVSLSLNG